MCLLVPNQSQPCVHQICQRLQQFIEDNEAEKINKKIKNTQDAQKNQLETLEGLLKDVNAGFMLSNNNAFALAKQPQPVQTHDLKKEELEQPIEGLKFPSDILKMTKTQVLNSSAAKPLGSCEACQMNNSRTQIFQQQQQQQQQKNQLQQQCQIRVNLNNDISTQQQNSQLLQMIYSMLEQQNKQASALYQLQHQQQNIEFSMIKLVDEISQINKQFALQSWIQQQQMSQKQYSLMQNLNSYSTVGPNLIKVEKIEDVQQQSSSSTFGFPQQKTQFNKTNSSDIATAQDLIDSFYGQQSFSYKLVLKYDLESPLYRERNFKIQIELQNNQNKTIYNQNKIGLGVALYTCENPPKQIEFNMNGQKVFKGKTDKILFNGSASFEKIHIKEVTSHFRNGWIFIVIYPKQTFNSTAEQSCNIIEQIDYKQIKPLVIEKVQIKAKKLNMKDQLNSKYQQKLQSKVNI